MLDLNKVIVDLQTGELSEEELIDLYEEGYLNNYELDLVVSTVDYIEEAIHFTSKDARDHRKEMNKYARAHAWDQAKRGALIGAGVGTGLGAGLGAAAGTILPGVGTGLGAGLGAVGGAIGAGLRGGIMGYQDGHAYGRSLAADIQKQRDIARIQWYDREALKQEKERQNYIEKHQQLQRQGARPITPPAKQLGFGKRK